MPETRTINHTASDKVHVAGSPDGAIQRCTRCHAKIADNGDNRWAPAFWRVGTSVLSRRIGKSVLTEDQAAEFRACGRKAGEVSK